MKLQPSRPEILESSASGITWRINAPDNGEGGIRPCTWVIKRETDQLCISLDFAAQGQMRHVDFRDVRGQLNAIMLSEAYADLGLQCHRERLRQSLRWQRSLKADHPHMPEPIHLGADGWTFHYSKDVDDAIQGDPLGMPVLRQVSNQMMEERREERLWAAYQIHLRAWAQKLNFDFPHRTRDPICRVRIWHYCQIPECRELFISCPPFVSIFGIPGLVPELEIKAGSDWREGARQLASLPRREWMERLGLPPTRQVVGIFSRLDSQVIAEQMPLVCQVLSDPEAVKLLSHTTCNITCNLLLMLADKPLPLRWSVIKQLCENQKFPHWILDFAFEHYEFFRDELVVGPKVLRRYRTATSGEQVRKLNRVVSAVRRRWHGLFDPDDVNAIKESLPPIPASESIQHINKPQELLEISIKHELCLDKYVADIINGKYALYRIDLNGEFAVAGILRDVTGVWVIDQIRGSGNSEVSPMLFGHFTQWFASQHLHPDIHKA